MNIIGLFTTGKYWLIAIAVAFVAGGGLGWYERVLREPAMFEAQKKTDAAECTAAQLITKETNDDLQKDRDDITQRRVALGMQQPAACVPVSSAPYLRGNRPEYAGQAGIGLNSDWLRDYAAECESYRTKITRCVNFLKKERRE